MPEPYILFQVDGTTYAVPSAQVQQVEMVEKITHVPNAPEFVEGVVYLRDRVVPVISVRRRFHLEKTPYDLRSRLIVVRMDERVVGMAVDAAREFARLAVEDIQPLPEGLSGPGREYLEGVVSLRERLILIANLRRLLTFEEKQALAGAFQAEDG
jgi:purine-binding chemotaxis protein CheW